MPLRDGYENAVNFTISFCLSFTLCIAGVRFWIRRGIYGYDDLVTGLATLFTLGHTAASYGALVNGLGKPWIELIHQQSLAGLNDASMAGIVLFLFALYMSKSAMLWFLVRLTKNRPQIHLYQAFNVAFGLLCLVSLLTATVDCPLSSSYYWAFHANRSSCPSQSRRWQVVTALDIISEAVLLLLPIHLIWHLQMPKSQKAMILIAFWVRLPIIGLSVGRNYFTLHLRLPQSDAGLDSAVALIWMEIELAYALAAGTLSALKSFTASFNSGFGLGFARGQSLSGSRAGSVPHPGVSSFPQSEKTASSGPVSPTKAASLQQAPSSSPDRKLSPHPLPVNVSPFPGAGKFLEPA